MKKLVNLMVIFTMLLNGALFLVPVASATSTYAGEVTTEELLPTTEIEKTGLGNQDIRTTIAQIIRVAMGLLGIVAVVIILIGGFYWMTAGGAEDRVETGKKWIFSGIIGLAIILSAYALTSFVISNLVTATTGAM